MQFTPCRGGDFCSDEGSHCQGCGRSHEEIAQTRALIAGLSDYALEKGYDNVEEFTRFVADKAVKKTQKARLLQGGGIGIPIGIK